MTLLVALAAVAGSAVAFVATVVLATPVLARAVPRLVGIAVGVLLAVAFLDLLPEAFERGAGVEALATLLAGLVLFFVLDKTALWRHSHGDAVDAGLHVRGHAPVHAEGRSTGLMILVGDSFRNFIDGTLIAAAFLADPQLGVATTLAVVAHEVPQQIGDFLVLLGEGTRRRALGWNLLAGLAAVTGCLLAWQLLASIPAVIPHVLALAAASFIYTAMADLIPGMQRRWDVRAMVSQLTLIGAGVAAIAGLHQL